MSESFIIEKILVSKNNRVLFENTCLPIKQGDITGVYGKTGSGKSTLLRIMAGVDTAYTMGLEISASWKPENLYDSISNSIGYIEQSPKDNLITRKVDDELLFSLQSLGLTEDECNQKLEEITERFNIAFLRQRSPLELSEGQAQKIAIVEALSRDCKLLLLDEPTAHLDEESRKVFVEELKEAVTRNPECRVVLSSHDAKLLSVCCNSVFEVRNKSLETMCAEDLKEPQLSCNFSGTNKSYSLTTINAENLSYSYRPTKVFDNFSLKIMKGERVIIRGSNGSGKSTLLRLLTRLIRKGYKGEIEIEGTNIKDIDELCPDIAYLSMQDPNEQILLQTVREELMINFLFWGEKFNLSLLETSGAKEILDNWNISLDDPTFNLSYGQKKVLSLIPIFLKKSHILFMDEPFAGLDYELMQRLLNILDDLSQEGTTLCITSHERQIWENCNMRVVDMETLR